jgi:hypothetical protein
MFAALPICAQLGREWVQNRRRRVIPQAEEKMGTKALAQ